MTHLQDTNISTSRVIHIFYLLSHRHHFDYDIVLITIAHGYINIKVTYHIDYELFWEVRFAAATEDQ